MRRHVQLFLCALALTYFGTSTAALADGRWARDDHYDPTRIYGGVWLGFGGTVDVDHVGQVGNLGKTIGGQGGVDVVVARYLSLGGEVRVGGFRVGHFDDRNRLIDLDFKPRLRLPIDGTPLELYLTVPVGLTIPRLSDINGGTHLHENVGWNLGVGGGLNAFITHNFALNVEPIWLVHRFGIDGTDGNGHVKIQQFAIMLNAVLAI
ncbi:MAG: hypothetical protein JWN04_1910 [Myxococcaceae bacterium]|nr:hypothetical protein [Myxococcaceae bacterium]